MFKLSHTSIGFRIISGFVIILAIGTVSSLYGLSSISKVGAELKTIAEDDIPMTTMLMEISVKQLEQAVLLERVLRLGSIISEDTNVEQSLKQTEAAFIKLGHEVEEEIKKFEMLSDEAIKHTSEDYIRKKFQTVSAAARVIEDDHASYEKHAEEIFEFVNAGETDAAMEVVGSLIKEEEKLADELKVLLHDLEAFTEKSALDAMHHEESAIATMTTLTIVGVVVGVLLGLLISRGITAPMKKMLNAMEDIAEGEGDLTRRVDINGTDEIAQLGTAFNKFAEKIRGVMLQVAKSSDSVASGSSQISVGNLNLSQRTEEQASSLEETASSMEEMTSTVQQNAGNADQATQLAQSARNQAEMGGKVVSQAVTAMGEINHSSKKIAEIISVVEEIAFQTNLLALNAAVEAARAGDQGRGFAVVASEVRVLAGRSADAAKEIKGLIEDSVGKVQTGSELVDKSGETLQEIVVGVKKVSDIVFEIAAASQEQSSGIAQVNTAVTQMDEMTQQNAALVEEAAAASKAMEDQAKELINLVGYFKLGEEAQRMSSHEVYIQDQNDDASSQQVTAVEHDGYLLEKSA